MTFQLDINHLSFNIRSSRTYLFKRNHIRINKRTMLTSVRRGTPSMGLAQETFYNFCLHFQKLSYEELQKDILVIKFFDDQLCKNNTLLNKAFQMALDVTYNKRIFNRKDAIHYFEKEMSLKNPLEGYVSSNELDQSTLYTMLRS